MTVETNRRAARDLRLTPTARLSAIVLVIAFIAAGCGGGDTKEAADETSSTSSSTSTTAASPDTRAASTDVCGLLTPTAIDAALHVTVGEGELFDEGSVTICAFETADGSTTVKVSRYEPAGDLIANTLAGDPEANELAGVGDEAVDQLHIGQVTTSFRGIGIVISVFPAPSLEVLVQLARTAAGAV